MTAFAPDYKEVTERIADFKAKHPEGSLQPVDLAQPYRIEILDGQTFIVYMAAAYRTPDDPRPGIGLAWEPFPGKTPYTRDSELQNAETSSWGRAIVAALASESKHVASAQDVRNRQDSDEPSAPPHRAKEPPACEICGKPTAGSPVQRHGQGFVHKACLEPQDTPADERPF